MGGRRSNKVDLPPFPEKYVNFARSVTVMAVSYPTTSMETSPSAPAESAVPEWLPSGVFERFLASAVILFHLVAIMVWNMPGSFTQADLKSRISRYMIYTGLNQAWGMFAPEPGHINYYMAARITYADGKQRLWPIGRQSTLNLWDRLVDERNRKFLENIYDTSNGTGLYPQVALWVARVNNLYPNDPPAKVELMRFWSQIPPPPGGVNEPVTGKWSNDIVYSTTINRGIGR